MTRYRKRKLLLTVRIAVLLVLPFATALLIKEYPALKSLFESTGSISIDTPSEHPISDESIMISEGYGFEAETEPFSEESTQPENLTSPLETVSENAGEKPYPDESEWVKGGSIVRTTYGEYSGDCFFSLDRCGQVNNKTSIPNETLLQESRCGADFTVTDTDEPQVLIYHTHTTESFEPYVRDFYDAYFNYRTTDETKNIVMVGNAIQKELESRGIGVIHATDIHDYPSYNGSYARSRETIVPILNQYPSIKVVLDIHRDAISGEGTAYQPIVEINGKEASQIMIISGCDDGTLGMPDYIKNFHFACQLQQQIESDWKGLTRPILFDYRHYNQDLTTGSLLIEVGSHGNTLEQVQYSGQLIGISLAKFLESIMN